jgi:hypothetical protein
MSKGVGFYGQDWFAIKQNKKLMYESIIRTLLTGPGERVMRPEYGIGLRNNVFGLVTQDVLQDLTIDIHSGLSRYEPRLRIEEVTAELIDNHILRIGIVFVEPEDITQTDTLEIDYEIA